MEGKLQAHEELYQILQSKGEAEALSVFRRIRSGQDAASVLRYMKDGDLLLQISLVPETWYRYSFPYRREMPSFLLQYSNPYLDSLIYRGVTNPPEIQQQPTEDGTDMSDNEAQYNIPYHTAELVEPRIDLASPSQWTTVTANDALLRKLLKAYFLYVYTTFPFFHKDYFLEDMISGRNRFCSSLLVNAILAAACHGCNTVSNRTEYWNPSTLHYRFAAEARRLRELEIGTSNLTTIQAELVMALTSNMNAIDRVGWSHQLQAVAMADNMNLFEVPPASVGRKMRSSRAFTAWAVFTFQSLFCFHFFHPPLLPQPPRDLLPDPNELPNWYPEICIMYSLNKSPIRVHHADYIKSIAEFRTILADIGASAFPSLKTQNKLSRQQTLSFYVRIKQWYENLPPSLTVKQAVLPFQLLVHLHYLNILLCLFEPLIVTDSNKSSEESSEELGESSTQPGEEETPEAIVLDAKVRLETVWRLYYMRHGFEFYDPLLLQYQILLGFMGGKALSQSQDPTSQHAQLLRATVVLAGKGMHDHAKNYYLAETTFRLFRETLDSENARLLKDYADISDTQDEERKTLIAQQVRSEYPINIVSIAENPEHFRVSNLIAAYRDMGLMDETEDSEQDRPSDETAAGSL